MILIFGASGHVGGRIAEILSAQGHSLRLTGRKPEKIQKLPGADIVRSDYADPAALDQVFKGVETAFIVSGYAPPGERAQLHKNAIDAASRAKTRNVVYLSVQNPSPDSKFPMSRDHYQTEQFLKASGLKYTALRDNLYMDMIPEMFGQDGVLKGPAGKGKVAWVSREDVAQAAAAVLSNPDKANAYYDIAGPEAIDLHETAERLSNLTGKRLRYEEESLEEAKEWRSKIASSEWEVETWIGSYAAISAGEYAKTSDAVEKLTGRKPYSIEQYFKEKREALQPIAG